MSLFLIPKILSSGQGDSPSIRNPLLHAQDSIERVKLCPTEYGKFTPELFSIDCIRPPNDVMVILLPLLEVSTITLSGLKSSYKSKFLILSNVSVQIFLP
jgi:hypothetical protein